MIRTVAGSGAVRGSAMLASFLVGVQLARELGVQGYGWYSLALSIVTIAGIPGELGLSKLVTREVAVARAKNEPRALFGVLGWADRTCGQLSALMVLAILVAAYILHESRPILAEGILFGAPMIPLLALSRIRGGALQGLNHIVRGQIPANLLRQVFLSALLATVYLAGIQITPPSAMLLYSATAAMVFVIAHIWLRNRLPPRTAPGVITTGRRWLASSIPFALTDGMRLLQSELTILLLGIIAAPADVGLFRIAIVTSSVAAAPLDVLIRATQPLIARFHVEGNADRLQKLLRYSAYVQTAGVVLLSLPLLIAPTFLLSLVFGPSYAPAADALRIVALAQIANAAFGLNVELLNMTHHEQRVTRAMAIGLALNVATVLLLARQWGVEGAAIGFAVSLVAWNILTWLDARRILGLETAILWLPGTRQC